MQLGQRVYPVERNQSVQNLRMQSLRILDQILWSEEDEDYYSAARTQPNDCMMLTTATIDFTLLSISNKTAEKYLFRIADLTKRFAEHNPDMLRGCLPFREVMVIIDSQEAPVLLNYRGKRG